MAEIIINDVKYTNVPNKKAGTKFASALTQSNIGISQAVQDYVNSSYFYALVNAIDINWDGIDIGENTYINTTSDLIKWIESKAGDIDLSSYATITYVNQKIEDLIGGAPETLDTLKELADALQEDATLSYVTEALDGKADKTALNDYVSYTQANSYYMAKEDMPDMNDYATVSYVTSELEKKADLSDIPSAPDLTPYVTYADANSYYVAKEDMNDYATVSYVTTELDKKADANNTYTKTEVNEKINAIDLSSYATNSQLDNRTLLDKDETITTFGEHTLNDITEFDLKVRFINDEALQIYIHANNSDSNSATLYLYGGSGSQTAQDENFEVTATYVEQDENSNYIWHVTCNAPVDSITFTNNDDPTSLGIEFEMTYGSSSITVIENFDNYVSKNELSSYNFISYSQANSYYAYKSEIPDMTSYVSKENLNSIGYLTYSDANTYYVLLEDYGRPNLYQMDEDSGSYILNNPFVVGSSANSVNFVVGLNNEITATHNTYNFIWGLTSTISGNVGHRNFVFGGGHVVDNVMDGFVTGSGNNITNHGEIAFGIYNISHNDTGNKTLLSIGNGTTNTNRHNIFEIKDDGKLYICDTAQGTPYCLQTALNSKANISYVTTELNKKADLSDIPSAPDLTPYVSYTDANSYYVDKTSYNALYSEVQHLAYLISYYHPAILTPASGYWEYNGMQYSTTFTISQTDSTAELSFSGTPAVGIGTGTWTFSDPQATGIQVASVTGNIEVNPSTATAGMYTITANYSGDANYSSTTITFTIDVQAPSKIWPSGYWVDENDNRVEMPLAWSDEGGELDGKTFTLVSTPASGWSSHIKDGESYDQGYTVDDNTITFGNVQSPPGVFTYIWSYPEDSTYYYGSVEMRVVGLQYGADSLFFPDCGNSEPVYAMMGSDTYYGHIINRTGIDLSQYPITFSSDNQNVTVTTGAGNDEFMITNTIAGTVQHAEITATLTDGNDTHTTRINVYFNHQS